MFFHSIYAAYMDVKHQNDGPQQTRIASVGGMCDANLPFDP